MDEAKRERDLTIGRIDVALIRFVALLKGVARLVLVGEQAAHDPGALVARGHGPEAAQGAHAGSLGSISALDVGRVDDVGIRGLEQRIADGMTACREAERGEAECNGAEAE